MNGITKLYTQYQPIKDRRQVNIPVAFERRSGIERRSSDRVALDSKLTRDIFQVKEQVAKLDNFKRNMFNIVSQSPSFHQKNNLKNDIFVKETKPDITEKIKQEAKLQEKESTAFKIGVLSAALASVAAVSMLGPVGIIIAVGSSVYIGSKIFKNTLENELKDTNTRS